MTKITNKKLFVVVVFAKSGKASAFKVFCTPNLDSFSRISFHGFALFID